MIDHQYQSFFVVRDSGFIREYYVDSREQALQMDRESIGREPYDVCLTLATAERVAAILRQPKPKQEVIDRIYSRYGAVKGTVLHSAYAEHIRLGKPLNPDDKHWIDQCL